MHDKRVHPRIPLSADVACEVTGARPSEARQGHQRRRHVHRVETSVSFGTEVSIVLRLPNAKADLRLPAVIRWLARAALACSSASWAHAKRTPSASFSSRDERAGTGLAA